MNEQNRKSVSDFESFETSSPRRRRLLRQEQLIVEVGEALAELLERDNVTRSELGHRLGKTKGFVSQILAGDKNLTLRTISDVCDALGYRAHLAIGRDVVAQESQFFHLSTPPAPRLNVRMPISQAPNLTIKSGAAA